jgi:hypothetical protein
MATRDKALSSGRRPVASMRWELPKAGIEFGSDVRTLLKKLEQAHQYPDRRGTYSTRQIVDALFDEQYRERTEMLRSQAEKLRIQNEVRRGELLAVVEVAEFCHTVAIRLRALILGLACPDADKQEVFRFLASLDDGSMLAERPRKKAKAKVS